MAISLMLRVPIICVLLTEIYAFQVIFKTAKRMMSRFMTILLSFYLFLMFYSIIGQGLYSGKIELTDPMRIDSATGNELYFQLNFNDNLSGMLVLFCTLTANNWPATTAMYIEMVGTNGPYWFFSIYFVLAIMVVLNIVISFVMEIYALVL